MNRKKITSIILAYLVTSLFVTNSTVFAASQPTLQSTKEALVEGLKENNSKAIPFGINSQNNNIQTTYTANNSVPTISNINIKSKDIYITKDENVKTYIPSNIIELSGTLDDSYFSDNLVIDSIKYQYSNEGELPLTIPSTGIKFNTSTKEFSSSITLDETKGLSPVSFTINAHNTKSNNAVSSSFKINVVVDDKQPTIDLGTLTNSTEPSDPQNIITYTSLSDGVVTSNKNITLKIDDINLDILNSRINIQNDNGQQINESLNNTTVNNDFFTLNNFSDGFYRIFVHALDLAKNTTEVTKTFIIDNTKPVIKDTNIKSIKNNNKEEIDYYKKGFNPYVTVYEKNIDKDKSYFKIGEETIYFKDLNEKNLNWKDLKTYTLTDNQKNNYINSEGKYTITIHVQDEAGNTLDSGDLKSTFYIDSEAPLITDNSTTTKTKDDKEIEDTKILNNNCYKEVVPKITFKDNYNIDKSSINVTIKKDLKDLQITDKNYDFNTNENSITFKYDPLKADGVYTITVTAADNAGNKPELFTRTFTIDNTNPEIKHTNINSINNNNKEEIDYYKKDFNPYVTVDEKNIDKDKSYFKIGEETIYFKNLNEKDLNSYTLTDDQKNNYINSEGKYTITIHVQDEAGNTLNSGDLKSTFYIDSEAPSITDNSITTKIGSDGSKIESNAIANNDDNYYTGVTPIIIFTDNYNIDTKSVKLNGQPCNGRFDSVDNGYKFTADSAITTDGVYTIEADATDKAGNTTEFFTKTFTIDNTKPNIAINGVQDNEFNNKTVTTPSVIVTDTNNELSNTTFNLTKNGEKVQVDPLLDDNGVFKFNVMDEGLYKLTVTAIDKAGNSYTTPTLTFTINRTKPVIKFNLNNDDYVSKAFTPVITIIDPLDTATIFDFTINGETYDPNNIPLLSENKKYEIKAKAKDKAGNISDESIIDFTVDTIAPEVDISGLVSNFFYNKTIQPLVTSKDTNPDTFVMTLNDKPYNNETISEEGTYQLKITSTDKAKNVTTKVVDFVIDKTKPVINIQGVIDGKIFNSIIKPIIDVNKTADITLLLDGEDYHGEPIDKDGKHTLVIKAIDKAGNLTESTINFLLKMTPPTIKICDVEDGKTYNHSVTPIIILSDDSLEEQTVITLDNKAYVSGQAVSSLGKHELSVETKDSAGNIAKKTLKFYVSNSKNSSGISSFNNKNIVLGLSSIVAIFIASAAIFKFKRKRKNNNEKTS